jgi:hypothetical protein
MSLYTREPNHFVCLRFLRFGENEIFGAKIQTFIFSHILSVEYFNITATTTTMLCRFWGAKYHLLVPNVIFGQKAIFWSQIVMFYGI